MGEGEGDTIHRAMSGEMFGKSAQLQNRLHFFKNVTLWPNDCLSNSSYCDFINAAADAGKPGADGGET